VSSQHRSIGHDDVVANDTVMGNMNVAHEKIVRADRRRFAWITRPINGHVLAEPVAVTDFQSSRFPTIFQILRGFSDDSAGKKQIFLADRGKTSEIRVRPHDALRADMNALVDDGIRTNANG